MCVIQTYTGKLMHPLDPRPEEIDIIDIAHALSMICRFTGHCSRFYSVAEHSVNVMRLVEYRFHKLSALLHDASEAYLGDLSSPIKHSGMMLEYEHYEEKLQAIINFKFGIVSEYCFKRQDRAMTGYEALQLLKQPLLDADGWKPYTDLARSEPLLQGFTLTGWPPWRAKYEFLKEFNDLQNV